MGKKELDAYHVLTVARRVNQPRHLGYMYAMLVSRHSREATFGDFVDDIEWHWNMARVRAINFAMILYYWMKSGYAPAVYVEAMEIAETIDRLQREKQERRYEK